jgi:Rrf2 family protein
MLSNTSKYAVRALIYLALNETPNLKIGIKQISKDLDIPMPFLGKIMQTLAKQKVLSSSKGPHGGFNLNKKAHEIFLMDIIEIIDGIDSFNMCILGLGDCNTESNHCPIHQGYAEFRETLKLLFQKESLGVLADRMRESKIKLVL